MAKEIKMHVFDSKFAESDSNYNSLSIVDDYVYYTLCTHDIDFPAKVYRLKLGTNTPEFVCDLGEVCGETEVKRIPQGKSHTPFFKYNNKIWFATHCSFYGGITPDGKDFSLVLDDFGESAPAWVAVQNYRLLESDLTHGTGQMLKNLGFDATYTGNVPEPTDILFTDFQAAMLRIITPELYDSRFSGLFSEKEGKLQYQEVGATGVLYLVDRLEQNEDGSWLSYEHTYHLAGSREDYTARVTLSELPDGRLVVGGWEQVSECQPIPHA